MEFPKEIFSIILNYCDDRIEKQQKKLLKLTLDILLLQIDLEWKVYLGADYESKKNTYYWNYYLKKEYIDLSFDPDFSDITLTWWSNGKTLVPVID